MNFHHRHRFVASAFAMLSTQAYPARAQADDQIQVTATIAAVSDYRFRGVSVSHGKLALQGGLELARDGWFGGAWASTLGGTQGSEAEVDFYAGRKGILHGLRYSLGGYVYIYPDAPESGFLEVRSFLERDVGPGQVTLEGSFTPKQRGLPSGNVYIGMRGELPLAPPGVSIVAGAGVEGGSFGRKLDWELGAKYSKGPVIFAASVVGSSLARRFAPDAEGTPGMVLSVAGSW
jgi:uncharacterized protein (TIGR02001 family)